MIQWKWENQRCSTDQNQHVGWSKLLLRLRRIQPNHLKSSFLLVGISLVTASQVRLRLSRSVCRPCHQCLSCRKDSTGCCCSSGQHLPIKESIRIQLRIAEQSWAELESSFYLEVEALLPRASCPPGDLLFARRQVGGRQSRLKLALMCARLSLLANWTAVVEKRKLRNWKICQSLLITSHPAFIWMVALLKGQRQIVSRFK